MTEGEPRESFDGGGQDIALVMHAEVHAAERNDCNEKSRRQDDEDPPLPNDAPRSKVGRDDGIRFAPYLVKSRRASPVAKPLSASVWKAEATSLEDFECQARAGADVIMPRSSYSGLTRNAIA
jgi:hypothetical protein